MTTIEIMGGLGNQLFQVFNLISYSLSNKLPFYFEHKEKSIRSDRPYYWDNFLDSLKPYLKTNYTNLPLYKEKSFSYNELIYHNKQFKFHGYYQSYKYFVKNENEIFDLLNLDKKIKDVKHKYENICEFPKTISLHFRIGDYKNIQHCHPVLNVEYYISSINIIIKRTGIDDWNILYFYENQDTELVEEKIKILKKNFENIKFISIDTNIVDYEQMLLISLCEHNIMANSSFSWWGTYLNKNKDKIVCYPNVWFGTEIDNKNTDDLFLSEWNKIIF